MKGFGPKNWSDKLGTVQGKNSYIIYKNESDTNINCLFRELVYFYPVPISGTQPEFLENICSEDDLRSRIFETFVVKFLACLPLLGFSNI